MVQFGKRFCYILAIGVKSDCQLLICMGMKKKTSCGCPHPDAAGSRAREDTAAGLPCKELACALRLSRPDVGHSGRGAAVIVNPAADYAIILPRAERITNPDFLIGERSMSIRPIIRALMVIFALAAPSAGAQTTTADFIQAYAEQLLIGADVEIGGTSIASAHIIPELYQRRSFQPAWTSAARVNELINLIGRALEEGLSAEDYNYSELREFTESFRDDPYNPHLAASFDILLTDSLARYGYHLMFGKVDAASLDQNWNWSRSLDGRDPAAMMQNAIDSDSLETYIHRTLDRGIVYYRMKDALTEYRGLQAGGGWPAVASGPTLKPGMEDERVPVIRRRLVVTRDFDASAESQSRQYDTALQEGVMKFQGRHNLDADSVIGPQEIQVHIT